MIIYFFIALCATLIGAAAGMGGGVIIKPLMDLMGDYQIVEIAVFASITVLSMAVVATIRQLRKGFTVTPVIAYITTGAVIGGVAGGLLFAALKAYTAPEMVTAAQSLILLVLLLLCLVYEQLPHAHIKSAAGQITVGALLGVFSAFLSIGGGPINVAVLCLLLNFDIKQAARVSVFIILFSQAAGLLVKAAEGSFSAIQDYRILIYMIPAAILGGLAGAWLNVKLPERDIRVIYKVSVILVMLVCLYNFICSIGWVA